MSTIFFRIELTPIKHSTDGFVTDDSDIGMIPASAEIHALELKKVKVFV